jgi:hypothetical protein
MNQELERLARWTEWRDGITRKFEEIRSNYMIVGPTRKVVEQCRSALNNSSPHHLLPLVTFSPDLPTLRQVVRALEADSLMLMDTIADLYASRETTGSTLPTDDEFEAPEQIAEILEQICGGDLGSIRAVLEQITAEIRENSKDFALRPLRHLYLAGDALGIQLGSVSSLLEVTDTVPSPTLVRLNIELLLTARESSVNAISHIRELLGSQRLKEHLVDQFAQIEVYDFAMRANHSLERFLGEDSTINEVLEAFGGDPAMEGVAADKDESILSSTRGWVREFLNEFEGPLYRAHLKLVATRALGRDALSGGRLENCDDEKIGGASGTEGNPVSREPAVVSKKELVDMYCARILYLYDIENYNRSAAYNAIKRALDAGLLKSPMPGYFSGESVSEFIKTPPRPRKPRESSSTVATPDDTCHWSVGDGGI